MERIFFTIGALSAFISVGAGAFGAHGLKHKISTEMLNVFEIGVRYQMYHALALIAVAWALGKWPSSIVSAGGWLFLIGTLLFSGSLYQMSLTGAKWLGIITPIGGFCFLIGWLCLALGIWKS